MSSRKRRKLESTVAALQQRYGGQAVRKASDLKLALPPAIPSGFAALDQLTGCHGLPLNAVTLLSGPPTSGKLTLAYKALANVQQQGDTAMILDLNQTCDPDYLERCGVVLAALYIVRPAVEQAVPLLLDLLNSRKLRLILVDSLPDLLTNSAAVRLLRSSWDRLKHLLRDSGCALILLDDPAPLWQRWWSDSRFLRQQAALHIDLRRERWLYRGDTLIGYQSAAHLLKSRWPTSHRSALLEIVFNGTVRAREVW